MIIYHTPVYALSGAIIEQAEPGPICCKSPLRMATSAVLKNGVKNEN